MKHFTKDHERKNFSKTSPQNYERERSQNNDKKSNERKFDRRESPKSQFQNPRNSKRRDSPSNSERNEKSLNRRRESPPDSRSYNRRDNQKYRPEQNHLINQKHFSPEHPPKKNFRNQKQQPPPKIKSIHSHTNIPEVYDILNKGKFLATLNLVKGQSVYHEKLYKFDGQSGPTEYREWIPTRSKIGSAVTLGLQQLGFGSKSKVLYLGASSGTTVSHVSDIVGFGGWVYAVEFSHRSGRDLLNLAKNRQNIIPIIQDARYPIKYRMLVPIVDFLFCDVSQPDQARIFSLNGRNFLKNGGNFMLSIKANCISSTIPPNQIYAQQKEMIENDGFQVEETIDISVHHSGHILFYGSYFSKITI